MQNNYEATKLDFENLRARYGNPIIILNLIKVSLPSYSGVAASCHCICTWMIFFCMLLLWWSLLFTWKTRERRESILRCEFDKAIKIINKSLSEANHLRFLHWDLHQNSQGYSLLYFTFPLSLCLVVCVIDVVLFQKTYKCTRCPSESGISGSEFDRVLLLSSCTKFWDFHTMAHPIVRLFPQF